MILRILYDALREQTGFGLPAAMVRAVLRHAAPGVYRRLSLDHSPSLAVWGDCPCRDCRRARGWPGGL